MKSGTLSWAVMGLGLALALYFAGCSEESDQGRLGSNPPLVIEPNLSVGNVRAGMSAEELVTRLGEPQRRTANALEYTRLGFAVMPGPDGIVRVVMCGDVTGIRGPLVAAFTGRTKEGIGMNSTRDDLVKTYGEPTSDEKLRGGMESMKYAPLGITFTLEGGKVYHMIVRLGGTPEPDRTVTLEPSPGTTQK
jgi:hypothetical protein